MFSDTEPQFALALQLDDFDQYTRFKRALMGELRRDFLDFQSEADADYLNTEVVVARDADVEDDEVEEVEGPRFGRKPTFSTTNSKIGISTVDELVYVYTGQTQAELLLRDQKDVRFSSQRVRPDGVNVIAQNGNALELFSTEKMKSIAQVCYHINQSNVVGEIRDFSAGDGV